MGGAGGAAAAGPAPQQPVGRRITVRATLKVVEFINRVYHRLPPAKTMPRGEGSEIRKEAMALVEAEESICNINVIARILLLYKRCMDRDSMILSACLGNRDDLQAVILIKLGDLSALADRVLERVADHTICCKGRWHLQISAVVKSTREEPVWHGLFRTWAAHYFTRLGRALPYFLAEKEKQVAGNERRFSALRMRLRDMELQRWSRQPPKKQAKEQFGNLKFPVPYDLQDTVTRLAAEIRRRVTGPVYDGETYGAEALFHQMEEEAFTLFCGKLSPSGLDTSLLDEYTVFPPGSRTAQCLYYISGYICYRMARYSMKTANAFDVGKREMLLHTLFWAMECNRHRASTSGDVDDAAAARRAGLHDDLVAAVVNRRRAARGGTKPVVMASLALYKLITLLELNCRKRLTVGALCANPNAVATLERDLKADPLVRQEFNRTLQPVTPTGQLAAAERDSATVEAELLAHTRQAMAVDPEDTDLLVALQQVEDDVADDASTGAGEPAAKRRLVDTSFCIDERERGGPAILAAVVRLFVHVRGRDTVRSIMARRDIYTKEASSVSLRGSIAVVTKRLQEHLKRLAAKTRAASDAEPVAVPHTASIDSGGRTCHHAEADGVDADGSVPEEYLDEIDRALIEIGEDRVVELLQAGQELYSGHSDGANKVAHYE